MRKRGKQQRRERWLEVKGLGEEVKNEIAVYQPNDMVRLDVRLENETVWLTQVQLCGLFQRDVSVISRHIKNIFAEGELDKESNLHLLQIASADRPVAFYSLDVIISVGYRVKSVVGTRFRQWANKVLREYLLRGHAVNSRLNQLEDKMDRHFAQGRQPSHLRRRQDGSGSHPRPSRFNPQGNLRVPRIRQRKTIKIAEI